MTGDEDMGNTEDHFLKFEQISKIFLEK